MLYYRSIKFVRVYATIVCPKRDGANKDRKDSIMKKFALLALLIAITCALACGCSSKSNNHYHASAIELKPNKYALRDGEDLDIHLRQVTFHWDYVPGQPDLPYFSDVVVHEDYVTALVDSTVARHLDPKINPYTKEVERQLVGVVIKEPILVTNQVEYGLPHLDWVSVAVWHRN